MVTVPVAVGETVTTPALVTVTPGLLLDQVMPVGPAIPPVIDKLFVLP